MWVTKLSLRTAMAVLGLIGIAISAAMNTSVLKAYNPLMFLVPPVRLDAPPPLPRQWHY